MMNYNHAYLDKYDILHVVKDLKTAIKFAKNGKAVETDVKASKGFPVTIYRNEERAVQAYSATEIKVDGRQVNLSDFQEIVDLYKQLESL